jgi:hypothetical protein
MADKAGGGGKFLKLPGGGAAAVPFAPTDLASLAAWYDASQEVLANGAEATQITDFSGHGRDLPKTSASGPTYTTNALNGRPVYRFTPSNVCGAAFSLVQPTHVFGVFRNHVPPPTTGTWFDGAAGNTLRLYTDGDGVLATRLRTYAGGPGPNSDATDDYVAGFILVDVLYSGSSSALATNGTLRASGDAGANDAGGLTLNGFGGTTATGMAVDWAEMLIFNAALSPGDRAAVTSYLNDKYALF